MPFLSQRNLLVRSYQIGRLAIGIGPIYDQQRLCSRLTRYDGGTISEGTWQIKDDGMHCVVGVPGGYARIVNNNDGTYERAQQWGPSATFISVVNGKDF